MPLFQLFFLVIMFAPTIGLLGQNNSLFLPGAVNYVAIGDLDVAGDQLTVEALIQYTGPSVNIISKHTDPSNVNYLLRIGSFEITTTAGFANFGGVASAGVNLVVGETYHVAATYNGQFLRYYVNGCMTGEMPWTGNMVQNNLITAIGQQSSCECEQYQGYMDEVRIWNVARTQQEIANNMFNLPNPTTQPGLLAYYKFEGNFINVQGNAAWNGVLVGNPQFQPIPEPLPHEMHVFASASDALCAGEANGVINTAASGAYTPYEFSIDGTNFSAQNNFSGLAAGTYTVTARPQNNPNCAVTQTVVINDPNPLLTNLVTEDVSCAGANDGLASVNPQGGNGPDFTVEWTPGGQTTNQIIDLSGGNYAVSVKDSCKSFGDELVFNGHFEDGYTGFTTDYNLGTLGPEMADDYSIVTAYPSNYHNGFVGAGASGTGNFLVVNGSTIPNQTIWCQTIPVNPNTYYNFSLEISSMFNVSPAELEVTINGVPLPSLVNAPAAVNVWDLYEESWYSGGSTQAAICITNLNLQANGNDFGLDNISFKECVSCEQITPVVINEPQPLDLNFTFVEESCGGANDGEISFQVTGGTQPYLFSIDGGTTFQVAPNFQNLSGGNYNLMVVDANDCEETDEVNLPLLPPLTFDSDSEAISCFGANDGEITISNVAGGTGPYSFSIDAGTTFSPNETFANLSGGNYAIVIADANGCQNTTNLTVNEPDDISFSINATDPLCTVSEDGVLTISNLQGGTGNLETSLNQGAFSSTTTYNNLGEGLYLITIMDENGCQRQATIELIAPAPISFSAVVNNPNCFGESTGEIIFQNVNGGTGTYSFSINGGVSFQNDAAFSNVGQGVYEIVVSDANNCITTESVQVIQPEPIELLVEVQDVSCFANCDGFATVSIVGGVQPFTLNWNNGMSGQQIANLCRGTYTVTSTDANGCNASSSAVVNSPDNIIADFYFWEQDYTILDPRIQFYNSSTGATIYTWNFGDGLGSSAQESPVFTFPDEPGIYEVELIAYNENNCSDTAFAIIEIKDEIIYFVPNTFTPDDDGFNEIFKPIFTSGFEPWDYQLLIYNRWGEVVFESRNAKLGWDGSYGGKKAQDGTYIWRIEFLETMSDKRHVIQGHVNLLK